ncbi:MAG: tRNA preQ1(34) S-adenosylmethionine ribosyltransferase-isomerase QueA [Proteobacteria bacterium]|nr:MAG: tRNA preQ1(34) S-adenosylmethionine ribosyltransferase-isomerase QueA [Pseudomonadota bacterium]
MRLEQFDFDLPEDLIAQSPPTLRGSSRLLHLTAAGGTSDLLFQDFPRLMRAGDLLVFNDTRVIKARLFGEKRTGGKVELLIERLLGEHRALALMKASHPPHPGSILRVAGVADLQVLERNGDMYLVELLGGDGLAQLLERYGAVPLPSYIRREPSAEDEARYQTVYARAPGAVAAPTAGLHFDTSMLKRLESQGVALAFVTLHVGAGTFQPIRSANIAEHRMHRERYEIPPQAVDAIDRARKRGGRVVAVGTTSLRALESAGRSGVVEPGAGETDLFVRPGFTFRVADRLFTNLHLPRSTLLMLVCAFAGIDRMLAAYRHAVSERYRFFSYGDAMLIDRLDPDDRSDREHRSSDRAGASIP